MLWQWEFSQPSAGPVPGFSVKRWLAAAVALTVAACSDGILQPNDVSIRAADSQGLSEAVSEVLSSGTRPSPADLSLLMRQSKPVAGLQIGEVGRADGETAHYFIRPDQSILFFDSPVGQNRTRWADCPPKGDCEVATASTTLVEHLLSKGEKLQSLETLRHRSMDGKRLP